MLVGAYVAIVVSAASGSWLLAVLAAAISGAVMGWVLALTITRLGANMIIAGLGLNVVATGALGFLMTVLYGSSGTVSLPGVALLPRLLPQGAAGVPLIDPIFTGVDPLTVLAWASVAVLPYVLGSTRIGLWIRATGNAPAVVRAVGLHPERVQEFTTAFAGFFAGLAGAHLALYSIGLFNQGLSAGRGFIALAAFYFGRNHPWPTAAACLLFGFLDAAQIRMQTVGLPPRLMGAMPYLMVLAILVLTQVRSKRISR
jgi:simple sugar transport system permease protein